MPASRRTFLGAVGTALATGVSGCTGSDPRPVSLSVSNLTAEDRSVFVEILPVDIEADLSEKQLFGEWIDLASNASDGTSYVDRQDVFDAQKALVRVKQSQGYINEYTFVPDCPDSDAGEHVEVSILSATVASVSQNWCRT
ncbi:hypothetical protein [Halorussus marinus]|uniref:hypothetical protein n=1 Tax=Halorussus marinus TaxID=2505976 RepID=UPI00106EAAA9|nr:hypothetical protein [Halorussus marinus]